MNWTIAKIKDPNAKDPRWYLKALYKDLLIGLWTVVPLGAKYQSATVLARSNYYKASKNALIHNPPNMKNPSILPYS